jgi:hypothetical protein
MRKVMQVEELDRATARALVEAGYMPLARYIELFGSDNDEPDKKETDNGDI